MIRVSTPLEGGHKAVCQRGRWNPKGVDCEIPHSLEKGTGASEDACLEGGRL